MIWTEPKYAPALAALDLAWTVDNQALKAAYKLRLSLGAWYIRARVGTQIIDAACSDHVADCIIEVAARKWLEDRDISIEGRGCVYCYGNQDGRWWTTHAQAQAEAIMAALEDESK